MKKIRYSNKKYKKVFEKISHTNREPLDNREYVAGFPLTNNWRKVVLQYPSMEEIKFN